MCPGARAAWCSPRTRTAPPARPRSPGRSAAARPPGCTLRTQYLTIGDTGAHATLLSCPTWLWGAEHGVNEHGVAIGNERVATTHDAAAAPPALIGMDLVRLGLERARTAAEAVDVMTALLEACGQGGIADATHGEAYDSSFLVADPTEAFVLETAGRDYAAAPFPGGTAISNRLTLGTEWTRGVGRPRARRRLRALPSTPASPPGPPSPPGGQPPFSRVGPPGGLTPAATAAHLRDHGTGPWGAPGSEGPVAPPPRRVGADFGGVSVCMHVRGRYVTAASMIAELPDDVAEGAPLRVWVAPGSPCASIYVPGLPAERRRAAALRAARALERGALAGGRRGAPAGRGRPRRAGRGPARSTRSRTSCGPRPTRSLEHPGRWAAVGASWGGRAPGTRCGTCIH